MVLSNKKLTVNDLRGSQILVNSEKKNTYHIK